MKRALSLLVALLAIGALPARAAEPRLVGGELLPATTNDPAAAIAAAGAAGPRWVGWSVPAVPEAAELCCHDRRSRRATCSLAAREGAWGSTRDDRRPTAPAELLLLVEVERGTPRRLELVGAACPVEAAGQSVLWLASADPEQSLDWLETLATRTDDDDLAGRAVAAIAHHAASSADRRLAGFAHDRVAPAELREAALFWSGELRGVAGFELLDAVLASDPDSDLREHALFALTLSRAPAALPRLRRVAGEDADPDVRCEALFWLGQSGDPRAAEWIRAVIASDRDDEVREHGVFALAQLEDGTPQLVRLLRESTDAGLRRQALFWLGQSEDPRAMAALEELLNGGS